MLKVTIKIEDELGVSVEKVANYVDKTFSLSTFDEIEGLMELAKQDIFPVIESDLLQMQQDNFKKKKFCKVGKRSIKLRGFHGEIAFDLQDYKDISGQRTNYFLLTNQFIDSYDTKRLRSFLCKYSTKMSYASVSCLVKDMSSYAVSGQHICNVVESVSQNIEAWTSKANAGLQLAIPFIKSVDIYDIEDKELLLLEDAVGVKQQKQYRNAAYTKITQTVQTDVILVNNESNSNDYTVYVANNSDRESLNNQILAHLSRYSQKGELPIVVIADGARSIRKNLQNLLGMSLIFILDWYHLSEKIWQFMSQIAVNKLEKEIHSPLLVGLLWEGKVQDALCYLEHSIVSKNSAKKQELVDYLIKHEHEIIDYGRRKKAGKKIGSGAVEKANDIIVAHRQKKKGMAWSKDGSKALSILKALEVNQKWASFWQQAA